MFAVLFGLISFFGPATDCVLDNPQGGVYEPQRPATLVENGQRDDTAACKTSEKFLVGY